MKQRPSDGHVASIPRTSGSGASTAGSGTPRRKASPCASLPARSRRRGRGRASHRRARADRRVLAARIARSPPMKRAGTVVVMPRPSGQSGDTDFTRRPVPAAVFASRTAGATTMTVARGRGSPSGCSIRPATPWQRGRYRPPCRRCPLREMSDECARSRRLVRTPFAVKRSRRPSPSKSPESPRAWGSAAREDPIHVREMACSVVPRSPSVREARHDEVVVAVVVDVRAPS